MTNIKRTEEEKNTKRVILLGSTFVVLVVSIMVAFILIHSEIKEFKSHLKVFKTTLIQREKFAIKAVVDNLVNDIKYEENSKLFDIRRRIKNQTNIAFKLINMMLSKQKNLTKKEAIESIKNAIKKISLGTQLEFFIYDDHGTLLMNSKNNSEVGKSLIDLKDIDGKPFIKQTVEQGGWVEYLWFVPKSNRISRKITYSLKMKNLGITIGSGEFLDTTYSLNDKIINKINKEKFGKNDFIFIYEILSLSSSKNYSKLILEKNIITDNRELSAVEDILNMSDFKGNIFYRYDDKLTYSTFLYDDKVFISSGVNLDAINEILKKETEISHKNLNKKIISLVLNILGISIIFFIFSYFIAKKIEKMFKNYRIKIAHSQQLLIQKSKMASMGEMIGNIAHQWRQPLTQLSGIFLDLESAYNYDELNKKYLSTRVAQANDLLEYMSKTIDDFKEFYNPNSKEQNFYIRESIQNAIKIISSALKYHQINIEVNVDKSLHVKAFSNEFSQVILNIISNSKDIAITRGIKEAKIKIFSEQKDDRVFVHIEDNCGGIEESNLDKIFEPYFTTKYDYGTGIGLYMCKVIIENKMGGKIFAKNITQNLLRFTIELNI